MKRALVLSIVALALLVRAATAAADVFGPISLVSASPFQQVEFAHDPAISADGRYVAFDGSYGARTGVWRRDLSSGAVEPVAVGESGTRAGSGELPSISADGQYVSFTTTAPLVPGDHNSSPDVYVRNMGAAESQPCEEEGRPVRCAFELASAVSDGASEPEVGLSYQHPEESFFGSIAAGRSALSADGREVVFVTSAVSNLAGESTPALQVAVRYLDSHQTRLVSAAMPITAQEREEPPKPVVGTEGASTFGGVYAPAGQPPSFKPISAYTGPPAVGASISADGSTVAWLGQDVGQQAQLLAEETVRPRYAEPLWRRIADGPLAPTRRVTGGSDPSNPACAASGERALPATPTAADPCQGPFITEPSTPGTWGGGEGDVIPRLSADGYTVAFLANASVLALGESFGGSGHSDLYVADMHEGLTRAQALRPLTELASGDSADIATTAPIIDLGISPQGTQVAFTTKRTVFPLGSPAYVTAPSAAPGMLELFDANLLSDTLTRVTHGFEGGASEHPHQPKLPGEDPYEHEEDGALSPSYASNGNSLAFSSTASNLVYGDGNTSALGQEGLYFDGADAFAVQRVVFGSTSAEDYVSSPPQIPGILPAWRLGVTALSRRDGSVLLEVLVPGAGALTAKAAGVVRVSTASARKSKHKRKAHAVAAKRTVAGTGAGARAAGIVTLTLRLTSRYASLARQRGGLWANVGVAFTAPGKPALHEVLAVRFRRTIPAKRKPKAKVRRARHVSAPTRHR